MNYMLWNGILKRLTSFFPPSDLERKQDGVQPEHIQSNSANINSEQNQVFISVSLGSSCPLCIIFMII